VITLTRLVEALSRRWWALALLALAIFFMARRLFGYSARMRLLTGHDVFDLQGPLALADVAAQLAHYTPEAVRLYGRYSGIDFPFPFLVALFWAALAIWGLRRARPDVFASGDWRHWVPWCFLGCVCDWIENVANAWVIGRYPPLHGGVATLAVLAKYGKLVAVGITAVIAIAFALWGAYTSISRYVQRRAT
jgi:hypothetical protein